MNRAERRKAGQINRSNARLADGLYGRSLVAATRAIKRVSGGRCR